MDTKFQKETLEFTEIESYCKAQNTELSYQPITTNLKENYVVNTVLDHMLFKPAF